MATEFSTLPTHDNAAQTHAEARKALMMRTAKVVCQTGEYICVMRDVSEVGTSLSFLHDAPPERRIMLALANGLTYPIERVWAGKRQAGYRFASAVETGEFFQCDEPYSARPIRLGIRAGALLTDGRDNLPAQMVDLASHGARIECIADWSENRLLSFRVNGLPQRLGQIAWREEGGAVDTYGLQFQHPIPLADLAVAAHRLQPFDAPIPGGFREPLDKARAA
ncbi:MAG: PilZ domain-containing protein [Pseudomonadota bacterium]